MKILLLSTTDIEGGAARATYRLHRGLQQMGISSQMLVQRKFSDDSTVFGPTSKIAKGFSRIQPTLDSLPLLSYRQREQTNFSCQWLPDTIGPKAASLQPDLINLHWICEGYLQIETLAQFKQPVVWTLHDMWAFTGGCHYSGDCDRYTKNCGHCPLLKSKHGWDLSRWIWQCKANNWQNQQWVFVAPSNWLAQCVRSSSLFHDRQVEMIPNGIDTQQYQPVDRQIARRLLRLPSDKFLILFGAIQATHDRRKGFHLLQSALQKLSESGWGKKAELVVLGATQPANPIDLGMPTHYLGKLKDDIALSLVFAAADVFVAPSIQDNLPNTVLEAIACGTPCVAFNIGGMPDLIEHQQTGYLAQPFQIDDFVQGIIWILVEPERHQKLANAARCKAEREFNLKLQANRYTNLFHQLISRSNSTLSN